MAELGEIERVLRELKVPLTDHVNKSTQEYYLENREKSYRIEPSHQYRGRAMVIIMTAKNPEWEQEAKAINKMCHALYMKPEFKVDPTSRELFKLLQGFALNKENSDIDCTFVAIIGYGHKVDDKWFLNTKPHKCEVWTTCTQLFAPRVKVLKTKPKLFFIKLFHENGDLVGTDSGLSEPAMDHYIMYITTTAENGSSCVQHFSDVVSEKAHNKDMESVLQMVETTDKQLPLAIHEIFSSTSHFINAFPGIVDETKKDTGQINLTQGSKKAGPNRNKNLQLGKDDNSKDTPLTGKERKNNHNDKSESIEIIIEATTEPDTEDNKKDAEQQLHVDLLNGDIRYNLENELSENSETIVTIEDVQNGSVVLTIKLKDGSKLDLLKQLSDCNYLSSLIDSILITEEYLNKCQAEDVYLSAVLLEGTPSNFSSEQACKQIRKKDVAAFLGEDIELSASSEFGNEILTWFKDETSLSNADRFEIEMLEGQSRLIIKNVKESDKGIYRCESQPEAASWRGKTITQVRLYVHDFGKPSNVQCQVLNAMTLKITWSAASGPVNGYQIILTPKKGGSKIEKTTCGDQVIIEENLEPGKSYIVKVRSKMGSVLSSEIPREELTVSMPYYHQIILENMKEELVQTVDLMTIFNGMQEERLLRALDVDNIFNQPNLQSQKLKFLEVLQADIPFVFQGFKRVLKNKQPHVFSVLEETLSIELWDRNEHSSASSYGSAKAQFNPDENVALQGAAGGPDENPALQGAAIDIIQRFMQDLPTSSPGYASRSITESGRPIQGRSVNETATVKKAHHARDDDELSLKPGETVMITKIDPSGWWTGEKDGKTGIFPAECVTLENAIPQFNQEVLENILREGSPLQHMMQSFQETMSASGDMPSGFSPWAILSMPELMPEKLKEIMTEMVTPMMNAYIEDSLLKIEYRNRVLYIRSLQQGMLCKLAGQRWTEEEDNFPADNIEELYLSDLIFDRCEGLFDFLSRCENVQSILVRNVRDKKNSKLELSTGLCTMLCSKEKLKYLHFQQIIVGSHWGAVLKSVPPVKLKFLALSYNDLAGYGEHLVNLLAKSTNLLWLEIPCCGLDNHELADLIAALPSVSPQLNGLLLGGNSILESDHVITTITSLSKLKVLTLEACKLKISFLLRIWLALDSSIELLAIENNHTEESFSSIFVSHLQNLKNLKYLRVSDYQLKLQDRMHINTVLESRDGAVVCDMYSSDEVFKSYQNHMNHLSGLCWSE